MQYCFSFRCSSERDTRRCCLTEFIPKKCEDMWCCLVHLHQTGHLCRATMQPMRSKIRASLEAIPQKIWCYKSLWNTSTIVHCLFPLYNFEFETRILLMIARLQYASSNMKCYYLLFDTTEYPLVGHRFGHVL